MYTAIAVLIVIASILPQTLLRAIRLSEYVKLPIFQKRQLGFQQLPLLFYVFQQQHSFHLVMQKQSRTLKKKLRIPLLRKQHQTSKLQRLLNLLQPNQRLLKQLLKKRKQIILQKNKNFLKFFSQNMSPLRMQRAFFIKILCTMRYKVMKKVYIFAVPNSM